MEEHWMPVQGYPDYRVSDLGRVRSFKNGGVRILKPGTAGRNGRLFVALSRDRTVKSYLVSRLVLTGFCSPLQPDYLCLHGDGDHTNNQLSNLRWGTNAENRLDAVKHGTHGGLTPDQIVYARSSEKSGAALADELGCSRSAICKLRNGYTHQETSNGE